MKKKDLSYYFIIILASSISLYLSKISIFSPIYLIYLAIFPIYLIYIIYRLKGLSLSSDIIQSSILLIYILFLVIFIHKDSLLSGAFINIYLGLLSFIFIRMTKRNIKEKYYTLIIYFMIYITLIFISADTIYRLLHPDFYARTAYLESNWFYYYKKNSIMFADSNTTGLIALILYFFITELEIFQNNIYIKIIKSKHIKLILILLLIASFSRAAYIAFIIGILYKKYHSQTKKYYKNIIKYISIPIIIIMAYYIISYLYKSDLSFQSKFYIIDLAINVFKKFPIYNKIFGIGFLEWQDVLGIYTHNIYITYFIQTGFIGLILFILFVISTFKYAKYIWIPIFLVSLSFFSYLGMPFLFVPLAIICNIYDNYMEKRKYYENSIYYSLS